ncbi:PD-(D/E)XK nuclease family protein [bacterium]|nr:PD-(D/E)XK nuclease family protein [bacterium]
MADLKNEFSWSVSRDKTFERCKRQYYYQYYAKWGGWDNRADKFTKKCYLLSNMTNLIMWMGSIVHNVAERTLKYYRYNKEWNLSDGEKYAWEQWKSGWQQSIKKFWKFGRIKDNINLFEHYYNKEIDANRIRELQIRMDTCLKNFYQGEIWKRAREVSPMQWRALEELQELDVDSYKVWIKIDFGYQDGNLLRLCDWKTGVAKQVDLLQLYCYALFVVDRWKWLPQNIEVVPVYLYPGEKEVIKIDDEKLAIAREMIKTSCEAMLSYLDDPVENIANIERFPKTPDDTKCQDCFFQDVCD